MPTPLVEISNIYSNPLVEGSAINFQYASDKNTQKVLAEVESSLEHIIEERRASLGLLNILPLHMSPSQADSLRDGLKASPEWQDNVKALLQTFLPQFEYNSISDVAPLIRIPWWNANIIFSSGDTYNEEDNSLAVHEVTPSHSYIVQIMRSQKASGSLHKALSVSGVLLTSDGLLTLGWRGGHNLSDTLMTTPAGSIEYHTGEDPFFESLYAELVEETGIERQDVRSAELIGKLSGYTIESQPHYVFRVRTKLSFHDLLERWTVSMDQKEHKYLIPFLDDPSSFLQKIRQNTYDSQKQDPQRAMVTAPENIGAILPQCAASVLVHYSQLNRPSFVAHAEKVLDGAYIFKK